MCIRDRLTPNLSEFEAVVGKCKTEEEIAGSKEVWANGGEVLVLNFEDGCSTTNIIKKIQLDVYKRQAYANPGAGSV